MSEIPIDTISKILKKFKRFPKILYYHQVDQYSNYNSSGFIKSTEQKLFEENRELKKQLCYSSTLGLGPTPDYIASLQKEIKELKQENIKIIKKYHTRVSDHPLAPSNSIQDKGSEGTCCPRNKKITRDNIDGKYHVEGNKFEKIRGTRDEVWSGTAYQTTGELKKINLE